jgi:hypothetical protein
MPPDVDESVNPELYDDDPYDDEDEIFPFDMNDIGMALGDLQRESEADAPNVTEWTDVEPEDMVRAFLGEAVDTVWDQACEEIDLIRKSFERNFGTRKPTMQQLVDYFLGPKSPIARVFSDNLDWSEGEYTIFMRTFCVQCAYRLSAKELYTKPSYTDTSTLDNKDTYIAKWRAVGTSCLPNNEKASPASAPETLWMKFESAANTSFRDLIVDSMLGGRGGDGDDSIKILRTVFDDDKMHFQATKATAFLKISQHVRDNRRGPVCHHCVLTATGLMVGSRFERLEDTAESCTRQLVKQQLAASQGGGDSRVARLGFLEALGDRTY